MSMRVQLLKLSDKSVVATSSTHADSSVMLDIAQLPINTDLIIRYDFYEKQALH
jgi:hypothetical protein